MMVIGVILFFIMVLLAMGEYTLFQILRRIKRIERELGIKEHKDMFDYAERFEDGVRRVYNTYR